MTYELSEGVTQSMLTTFLSCPERMRNYLDGWRSASDSSEALIFGSLFHHFIEYWHNEAAAQKKTIAGLGIPSEEWCAKYLKVFLNLEAKRGPVDPQPIEEQAAAVIPLFMEYCNYWKKSHAGWSSVISEKVFDYTWQGYRLRGKVDGLLKVKGKWWILETKTKGQISDTDLSDTLTFDFQNQFYRLAIETELKTPVSGVIYNIARKPGLRQKQGGTKEELTTRIIADVAERPEHYFLRYEVVYTKKDAKRFEEELKTKLDWFKDWLEGESPHFRNETACIGRGRCPYLSACAQQGMQGYVQNGRLFVELE